MDSIYDNYPGNAFLAYRTHFMQRKLRPVILQKKKASRLRFETKIDGGIPFCFSGDLSAPYPYLRNLAEFFESGVRKQKSLDVSYSSQIPKDDGVRLNLRKTILLVPRS